MPDDLQRVIEKYGDMRFGDLAASEQAEYLMGLAKRGGIEGATSVLNKLGLNDDDAPDDIKDIRDLLRGFRVARSRAWSTIFGAIGKLVGWAVVACIIALFAKSEAGKSLLHVID